MRLATAFLIIGLGCWFAFMVSGSYVSDDGVLHESFGFIPIGWAFVFLSIIISIFTFAKNLFAKFYMQ